MMMAQVRMPKVVSSCRKSMVTLQLHILGPLLLGIVDPMVKIKSKSKIETYSMCFSSSL